MQSVLASQIIVLLLPDLPTIHCVHNASNQKLDAEKAQGRCSQLANQIANQIVAAINFDFDCAYQTVSLFEHMMDDVAQLKVL